MSPKQNFEKYLLSLDLQSYSDPFRRAIELARSAKDEVFVEIPNWWTTTNPNQPSNVQISHIIEVAAKGDDNSDTDPISVTINGQPRENLSLKRRKEILIECMDTVIKDWSDDRLGKNPIVRTQKPVFAVLGYPLPGNVAEQIKDLIGLPESYRSFLPRWQTLGSGFPELVVTITNSGNLTNPHVDSPGLQSDVYHMFGRKLWFVWEDSNENNQIMMNRTIQYDDIDLEWCYENLKGLKLMFTEARGAYYNPQIHLPPACWHAVLCFSPSMAISGYICDTRSYERCQRNIQTHSDHYHTSKLISKATKTIFKHEIGRAKTTWATYMTSDVEASSILSPQ